MDQCQMLAYNPGKEGEEAKAVVQLTENVKT